MGLSFTSKAWENSKVLLSLERKKPSNFSYPPWKSSGEVPLPAPLPQQNPMQKQHLRPQRAPGACSSSLNPQQCPAASLGDKQPPPRPSLLPCPQLMNFGGKRVFYVRKQRDLYLIRMFAVLFSENTVGTRRMLTLFSQCCAR